MKAILLLFVLGLFFTLDSSAQTNINLDGMAFSIQVKQVKGKKRGSKWPADTLSFESGKLASYYMKDRERFNGGKYEAIQKSIDTTSFVDISHSDVNHGGSSLKIQANVQGNIISGTIRWTSMAGTREYSFTGQLIINS